MRKFNFISINILCRERLSVHFQLGEGHLQFPGVTRRAFVIVTPGGRRRMNVGGDLYFEHNP